MTELTGLMMLDNSSVSLPKIQGVTHSKWSCCYCGWTCSNFMLLFHLIFLFTCNLFQKHLSTNLTHVITQTDENRRKPVILLLVSLVQSDRSVDFKWTGFLFTYLKTQPACCHLLNFYSNSSSSHRESVNTKHFQHFHALSYMSLELCSIYSCKP